MAYGINRLRAVVKTLLTGSSEEQRVRLDHGQMAIRNRFNDIKSLFKGESPVIADVGANIGTITDLFLQQYLTPTIYAFEPLPNFAHILREKYKSYPDIKIFEMAAGAESRTVAFNHVNRSSASSILPPSDINRKYHGDNVAISEKLEIQMKRLDDVIDAEVDIIKLDIQGYELEALKGAERLLKHVKLITTEVEFVPLYEGQPLFGDIDIFLRSRGFLLLNLYELYTHPDGQLTSGDAVYYNMAFDWK
jgi:FkbM family methyltransferase